MSDLMTFKEAYEMPIGKAVEKKGKFSYLSWCYAVMHLRQNYPDATWVIHENHIGQPIFELPEGFMVKVSVIVGDKEFPQWHPVLDNRNKPISKPNAFEINTSIQRCLTKAIALASGIGLGLYAGEDLPTEEKQPEKQYEESKLPAWQERCDKLGTAADRKQFYLDNEELILKELSKQDVVKLQAYLKQLKDAEEGN